jgi:hypothetical protein
MFRESCLEVTCSYLQLLHYYCSSGSSCFREHDRLRNLTHCNYYLCDDCKQEGKNHAVEHVLIKSLEIYSIPVSPETCLHSKKD